MFDCNQLKGHLRSICEGTYKKANGQSHTLEERKEIIGRYLRIDASQIEIPIPVGSSKIQSDIGTRLHAIIERDAGRIECSDCRDEVTRLNLLTVAQVQSERNIIAAGIVERGKKKAPKFWQRWGATLAPGVALKQALSWIDEACRNHSPRTKFKRIDEDAHFVWIYWAGGAEADELRWSIKSVEQNYAGTARITIIGDRPVWYDGHVIEQPRVPEQPFRAYRDTLAKIQTMISSEEIRGTIVWCMDDCYFLKQGFTLADVALPRKNIRGKYKGNDEWSKMNRATDAAITAKGIVYSNFNTHMPQVVDRDKLKQVFREFDFTKIPLCWESCYGSMFYPDQPSHHDVLLRINGRKVTTADCESAKEKKVVLNHHNGSWSKSLAQWLKEEFGTDEVHTEIPVKKNTKKHKVSNELGITIVIPCHNYARYLEECIKSIRDSTFKVAEIIVVDDSSDDNPKQYCDGVTYVRVNYKSQAAACREGFKYVTSKYVAFVDADDKVHPSYFENAISKLEADKNAACAFPYLLAFGDSTGPKNGVDKAKDIIRWTDIESRNWCPAGSVYRSEIVRQSLAIKIDRVDGCGCSDWITIRTIMRAGPWHAVKCDFPLYYRIHDGQMHTGCNFSKYSLQANHSKEIVTIIIAFSGRWECWEKLRKWILTQDWPRNQCRLMILNSTHSNLTVIDLGLEDWDSNIQIERIDVGYPALAEQDRRNEPDIVREVEAAVGGLYNRAIQMAYGEWMLFIEDDVIPQQTNTIQQLMSHVESKVSCVSGLYKHRYKETAVAFGPLQAGKLPMLPMEGKRVEQVVGSGFGCLLARRSVLSQYGLAGDDNKARFYDIGIGIRLANNGWKWILDRGVNCDHMTTGFDDKEKNE